MVIRNGNRISDGFPDHADARESGAVSPSAAFHDIRSSHTGGYGSIGRNEEARGTVEKGDQGAHD